MNSSFNGFVVRWTELFLNPMHEERLAWALVPLHQQQLGALKGWENGVEEEEEEGVGKWSGFLWAAPKKRTSIMKRIRRKFGHTDWMSTSKILKPKTNLRICDTCGHHHEAFHLCGFCYERIKKETELIRKEAEVQFGHGPEDKGIVVLYECDKTAPTTGITTTDPGKRNMKSIIVEIPKLKPAWFSANLLQRTTLRSNPTATEITPRNPVPTIASTVSDKDK